MKEINKRENKYNDMSVKRSFDTHLIPGLLRSYAAPAILQNIRNPLIFL